MRIKQLIARRTPSTLSTVFNWRSKEFLKRYEKLQIENTILTIRKRIADPRYVSINFIENIDMLAFNHGFTDVLAFPTDDFLVLGKIFINVDYIQKKKRKSLWISRLEEVATHALVHLSFRCDHQTFNEYQNMRKLEIKILGRPCLPAWKNRRYYK